MMKSKDQSSLRQLKDDSIKSSLERLGNDDTLLVPAGTYPNIKLEGVQPRQIVHMGRPRQIVHTGLTARRIPPEEVAKALGAEAITDADRQTLEGLKEWIEGYLGKYDYTQAQRRNIECWTAALGRVLSDETEKD